MIGTKKNSGSINLPPPSSHQPPLLFRGCSSGAFGLFQEIAFLYPFSAIPDKEFKIAVGVGTSLLQITIDEKWMLRGGEQKLLCFPQNARNVLLKTDGKWRDVISLD